MKKILVIYYTQTGQLGQAVNATLQPLLNRDDISVHFEAIKPKTPYPHPWKYMEFADVFAETIQGTPCALEPLTIGADEDFDLVVIAYQSWFLSISIPINSFLQTAEAKKLLHNKPVITIIACRNMWVNAQEKMKVHLKNLGANLVGNITFVDKAPNIVTLVTVLAFTLTGEKGRYLGIFPKYGVSEKDLKEAPKFGEIILTHLQNGNYESQQEELISNGAINIKTNLLLLEGRGKALFPLYANFITKKGGTGSKSRRMRVRSFGILLPTVVFILSPIITVISRLAPFFIKEKLRNDIDYYSRNALR